MFEQKGKPSLPDLKKAETKRKLQEAATAARIFVSQNGIHYRDGFQGLDPDELEELGLKILAAPSVVVAYDLMAEIPSDGSTSYYDRLIAEPQHLETYKRLDRTLRERETDRVDRAIDIASGSGFCAMLLSQRADHVAAVDGSAGLLTVAERELRRLQSFGRYMKTFETRQMDALALGYPDSSFDIATSNALTHYLTFEEQEAFYREVYRVLKPGGRYYEPQQDDASDAFYMQSARGVLAKVVSTTPLVVRDPVKFAEGTKRSIPDVAQYGFNVTAYVYQTFPFTAQVVRGVKV